MPSILQHVAETGPFAPYIRVRIIADFIGIFVLEARDGRQAHIGRGIGTRAVNDLMMREDEVARVAGDHHRGFGQVGPRHALGEHFVAVRFEIVRKKAMGLGPHREIAAEGFGHIHEINDGKGCEPALVIALGSAVVAAVLASA